MINTYANKSVEPMNVLQLQEHVFHELPEDFSRFHPTGIEVPSYVTKKNPQWLRVIEVSILKCQNIHEEFEKNKKIISCGTNIKIQSKFHY